jgi:uncharacterized membrane protein
MADPIVVACPQCQKQIKAPAEFQGKKIRCKGCGTTFPIQPSAASRAAHVDEDDANPYRVNAEDEDAIPRCPFCAKEMASKEAVVCLHCGYNTRTRSRIEAKTIIDTTPTDRLMWLLPGIVCVVVIVALVVFDILYYAWNPGEKHDLYLLSLGGVKGWVIIATLAIMFFAGRFAIRRLIFNSVPPEKMAEKQRGGD